MTIHNLEGLLSPQSIAVIGPNTHGPVLSERLFAQINASGFKGPKYVTYWRDDVPKGFKKIRSLRDLKTPVDLVVLLGDPEHCIGAIERAGKFGSKAAIIPASGFHRWEEKKITQALETARPHSLRILGPGSLGVATPHANLSALLTADSAASGDLALISRSGTIFNATLAWAKENAVGFSGVVSLGRRADVDVSDLLDWYAQDYRTRAILVHFETLENPRKFLSAARAAARSKPVIVIRSGASRDKETIGSTHAGRLASNDLVYDAALQRAGVLRVDDLDEMFHAAETVTRVAPPSGRRLAIVANGRSLATLAADCLERMGGEMAEVSPELKEAVCKLTREDAKASNPLVLQENASPEEFRVGIEAFLADKNCDGVLAIAAPTAFNNLAGIAATIAEVGEKNRKKTGRKKALITTLASGAQIPRAELDAAKVPCFASASEAIRAFMHLVRYREAKDLLMAAPDSLPSDFTPDKPRAKKAINAALAAGERWLSPDQVLDVLSAYQIPQVPMRYVQTAIEAGEAAKPFLKDGHACALKLISPDFTFKSDIDGVLLDLASQEAVQEAAEGLIKRLNRDYPTARIDGFEIQPMVKRANSLEVYAGLADSPIFGPVVVFGRGGTAVEVTADRAIELVPLDMNLAGALISRTHTHALLRGFRNRPAANIHELEQLLVKLSQLAVDFPEVRELDLNPVLVDREGLEVVDARIAVAPDTSNSERQGNTRLAIAPYPTEWEHEALLKDGTGIFLRPIRPEDQGLLREFFNHVTTEDLRLRFFAPVKEFSHSFLARLVQLDYARAMAFVAIKPETEEILGVVRLHTDANHNVGEYAVLIQSDMKGKGLGWMLMQLIIRYAKADSIATIKGEVLRENHTMIEMCRALGFTTARSEDDDALIIATLEIDKQA